MNNHTKSYYIFRYSIIKESQHQLFSKELPSPKGCVIKTALRENNIDREFQNYGVKYSFINFHYATPTDSFPLKSKRYIIGKIAKLKKTETGKRIPGDIIGEKQDDWIGSYAIFDTISQHIFIEKNYKFGKPDQFKKILQIGLSRPVLAEYNCKIFVKEKTDEVLFWNIINESTELYRLQLKMISPNILDTNIKARDALKNLQSIFEQDEIEISLKNELGDLSIPQDPIADYVNYISEGEGSWKITQKGTENRKRTFSSIDNIRIIDLPDISNIPINIPIGERPDTEKDSTIKKTMKTRESSLVFHLNKISSNFYE